MGSDAERRPRPAGDDLRASDKERDAAVRALHHHAAEGRLRLDELEERVGAALGARTRGELRGLLADLPAEEEPAPAPRRRLVLSLAAPFPQMLASDALFVALWLAAGRGGFWPVWLFIANGFVFLRRIRRAPGLRQVESDLASSSKDTAR